VARGIFCLEGQWTNKLDDQLSVRPILDLVRSVSGCRFAHAQVATPDELQHRLGRWVLRQNNNFDIGYLAFHGERAGLWLGRDREVSLDELGDQLEGKLEGRTLYLSACSVMAGSKDDLEQFVKRTQLRLLLGFAANVDWAEAAAFDMVVLDRLLSYERLGYVPTALERNFADLTRRLRFRAIVP
jgi:hypothetical protein